MKKLLKGLGALAIILVVLAILGNVFGSRAASVDDLQVGDTWEHKKVSYKVTDYRTTTGTGYVKPKSKHVWVIVEMLVDNKSSQEMVFSTAAMVTAVDDQGYSYDVSVGDGTHNIIDGKVAAGSKLKGEMVFEVPASAKTLDVRVKPDIIRDVHGAFRLNLNK